MKRVPLKRAFCVWAVAMLAAGCADTREQYVPDVSPTINGETPDEPIQSDLNDLFTTLKTQQPAVDQLAIRPQSPGNLSQDELNARTRRNSRLPVVYGEGAAGISFDTSLSEASALLDLDVGPLSDGRALYKEGLMVIWNNNQTRKPEQFILFSDYLGELPVPKKYGTVRIPTEMKNFFPESDPKGEQLLRDLYNFYEGTPDDYDCVADGSCSAITNSELIVHIMPGLILLYSRDVRKSLIQIKVLPSLPAGRLQNAFDIVEGAFHLPPAEAIEAGANKIPLGLSWGELKARAGIDHDMFENYLDGFLQRLNGVLVFTTRSNFDRDYQKPSDDEKVSAFAVTTGFTAQFVGRDLPVWVVKSPDKSIEIVMSETAPEGAGVAVEGGNFSPVEVFPLKPKMPQLANDKTLQANFVKAMTQELADQILQVTEPSHLPTVFPRVFGEHNRRGNRSLSGVVQRWNPATQQSLRWSVSLEEENASFSIEITEASTEFRKLIMPMFGFPVDVRERSLLGLQLGQTVQVDNVDLAKGEADVSIASESGVAVSDRAPYVAELLFEVLESSQGATAKNFSEVNRVSLSEGGVRILLQPVQGSPLEQRIVGISALPFGEIRGLCGLERFAVRVGQLDTEIAEGLKVALESEGIACRYQQKMSGDSDDRLVQLEFPEQGVRLGFEDRALEEVLIYMKREEGLRPIGGAVE